MPSPFGLRRRLKALFGIASAPVAAAPPPPKVSLTVVGPDGVEQSTDASVGATVLSASSRLRRPIASGCSESTCGTCRVEVLEGAGNLGEQTARERATLKENGYSPDWRLSCRAELVKDAAKVRAFELI